MCTVIKQLQLHYQANFQAAWSTARVDIPVIIITLHILNKRAVCLCVLRYTAEVCVTRTRHVTSRDWVTRARVTFTRGSTFSSAAGVCVA